MKIDQRRRGTQCIQLGQLIHFSCDGKMHGLSMEWEIDGKIMNSICVKRSNKYDKKVISFNWDLKVGLNIFGGQMSWQEGIYGTHGRIFRHLGLM